MVVWHVLYFVWVVLLTCGVEILEGAVVSTGGSALGRLLLYESGIGISTVVPEKMKVAVDTYD